ncbi:MAG TPA: NAD-dependent succinate-semialdehyde dehydrogenase [Candidatus Baltobacteraceae bacterium]|nr:NAD-dependent succinate-semialdehyde dehydrogenase [Candidatus Baltobacteraceae bacterium]
MEIGMASMPSQSHAAAPIDVQLFIGGVWKEGSGGRTIDFFDPATTKLAGRVCVAGDPDLREVVAAAESGFAAWKRVPAFERGRVLYKAAALMRERAEQIAVRLTREQGKPMAQARTEILGSADTFEWFAEEGKRCFGQVIPGRNASFHTVTRLEPVGIVAAFTPWNFPVSQSAKKLAAALAAGCAIILKGPEEAPSACAEVVRALADAGVATGAVNLVYGEPARISEYLIAHPAIRAVSFTGSVPVGKRLASLAGQHMKRVVMELGGHAPTIVCEDADLVLATRELCHMKFMNAGQLCLAPTRFLVARQAYEEFLGRFRDMAEKLRSDSGFAEGVDMGPLANLRRLHVMEGLIVDAINAGARLACGGKRLDREGFFFAPTVLYDVPTTVRAMNEEPFGPLALFRPFDSLEQAIEEANRLPYGLASYVYTGSIRSEAALIEGLDVGMVAVNRVFSSTIEAPFGGVKDSGYGTEGGTHAIRNFLNEKMITRFYG